MFQVLVLSVLLVLTTRWASRLRYPCHQPSHVGVRVNPTVLRNGLRLATCARNSSSAQPLLLPDNNAVAPCAYGESRRRGWVQLKHAKRWLSDSLRSHAQPVVSVL